jgi:hypothetical protein
MPEVLEYYLRDPLGIRAAETLRNSGYRQLKEKCRLPEFLRKTWGTPIMGDLR